MSKWTVVLGVALIGFWPGLSRAEGADDATRRAARNLGQAGVEAYEAGDYATASEKLDKAYRALQAPSLGLWSARALVKQNRLVAAAERYQEVQRIEIRGGDVAVQRQAQADARDELAKLSPQIPNLVVRVEGANSAEVEIKVDGEPLVAALIGEARPVDPGKHVVEGTLGTEKTRQELVVAIGDNKPVVLKFKGAQLVGSPAVAAPAPSSEPASAPLSHDTDTPRTTSSGRRTAGYVALGVGGAGLVVGGVATFLALGKKSDIDDNPRCQGGCLPSEQSQVDSYRQWRTISSIGLIGGGALAAAGVVLVVTAPKGEPALALGVGPGSLTFRRTF